MTPWAAACQASLSLTISWDFPKFISILLVTLYNHLILCCPFFFCLKSFPASGSFPMSQFFASGGQNIRDSALLVSVLPMTIQDWFPLGLTGLISLQSKGLSRVFSNSTVQKHQFSFLYGPTPMIVLMSLFAEISERWSLSTSCKRRSLTVCKPGRGLS